MEFPFYVSKVIQVDQEGFAILDSKNLNTKSGVGGRVQSYGKQDLSRDYLADIIDQMGEASSRAQGLGQIITTYVKFVSSGDNRLYLKIDNNRVAGILKVGKKNLFHYDGTGKVKEIKPLCVLDFYVHESVQRGGVGKALFEKMLQEERVEPHKFGYDRPSPKLIAFLQKHYGLVKFVPQNNNYVVFNQYWEETKSDVRKDKNSQSNTNSNERLNYYNKSAWPTEFNKVGRSILGNSNELGQFSNYQDPRYSKAGVSAIDNRAEPTGSRQNIRRSLGANEKYTYDNRNIEEGSYRTLEGRLKLNEEIPSNYKEDYTQVYGDQQTNQASKGYTSRPPWASYGSEHDSFKSSLTYGNHYNQNNANFSNGRRK